MMLIDKQQGIIHLPNGFIVSPDLTPSQLLVAPVAAKPYNLSALPFVWFSAKGAFVEGVPLLVEFCFHETQLVHADLHIDVEQDRILIEEADVTAIAIQAKTLQDRLLMRDLGVPHQVKQNNNSDGLTCLNTLQKYQYPWGEVISQHVANTFIRVEYVGRRQAAERDLFRASSPEARVRVQDFRKRYSYGSDQGGD